MDTHTSEASVQLNKPTGFAVQALEDGVVIIGISRGANSKLLHTERLDTGEIMIAELTEVISAVKIRGKAIVLTPYGELGAR